jgi:hypothetical protein
MSLGGIAFATVVILMVVLSFLSWLVPFIQKIRRKNGTKGGGIGQTDVA